MALRLVKPALTILDALDDPRLFQPWFAGESWNNWRVILKSIYGLRLNEAETVFFKSIAGGREPPARRCREVWIIAGRRAGKDALASVIAAHAAALFDQQARLRPGEHAAIACLACDRAQSRIILGYIKAFFADIPMLNALVERWTAIGVQLRNAIDIEIATNSFKSIRGRPFALVILDEVAFYSSETSSTPDVELFKAIEPGLATLAPNSMIIGISTPWRRSGLLHAKYKTHFGKSDDDVLVIQAPSLLLNPTLDPAIVTRALEADPAAARSEWLGQFRDDIGSWLDLATIENSVDTGVLVRPPVLDGSVTYFSGCDPSGGRHDSFTLAVSHCEKDVAILDALVEVRAPFNPETATQQIAAVLKSYGLSETIGDRYAAEWIPSAFARYGISYRKAALDRSATYANVLPLFNSGRVALIDNPRLVAQFAGLERRTTVRGDRIDHAPGSFDDAANSAALALVLAVATPYVAPMPQFGSYGRSVESNHLGQTGGAGSNASAYGVPGQPDSTVYPATADGFRSMIAAISEK
jgi:hypothetical protein